MSDAQTPYEPPTVEEIEADGPNLATSPGGVVTG